MKDFTYYLGIANHDILMAKCQNELKDYVASLLCEYDTLRNENTKINQKYLNAVSYYEQEKFKVEELKKQLQKKDYGFNVVNEEFRECAEENLKLLNRQLKFIKYLKDEQNKWHYNYDVHNYEYEIEEPTAEELLTTILLKYKEIIGDVEDEK